MRTAIFPGTFDPPTLGHLDIIKRAVKMFDKLYVGIGHNSQKPVDAFSTLEREKLLKDITKGIPNVEVATYEGLLVDFVKDKNISVIIRSIRNFSDYENEIILAHMNKEVSG